MKVQTRRQFPIYRKLLLENKILLLIAVLLFLLGALILPAQYWITEHVAEQLARDLRGTSAEELLPPEAGAQPEASRLKIRHQAFRAVGIVGLLMIIPVAVVMLAGRAVIRRAVEPLKELTRVADEISMGNLDSDVNFGIHVNCWDLKNCQHTDCKGYLNLSEQCWYIDGTPCEGYEPRFPQKLEGCRTCEVYQAHRGDEIVQLADAFRHMRNVLLKSREEILKSDEFQKRLIRNSFNGVVATDAEDRITIFNRVAEKLIGVSRDEVIGLRDWRSFFRDGLERSMDRPLTHERVRRVRGFREMESQIRREDGKLVDVLLSGISLYERGMHLGRVFFFQDMREVKKLREGLIRSERLAATGQAAAGISHSIKNILDGFLGGAYVFKVGRKRGDTVKMDRGWEMIERNLGMISELVKDLLNFAKDREPELIAVDPAVLIEETLNTLDVRAEGQVALEVKVTASERKVFLDRHSFNQCLANLVRNAMEAFPPDHRGTVTVRYQPEGDTAVFTVSDDGIGMNSETMEKVKGGMFSTKGSKGTGLGLLVIQKIVREHNGALSIESEEGKGTTFKIAIPAAVDLVS